MSGVKAVLERIAERLEGYTHRRDVSGWQGMLVPEYWAEATQKIRRRGRSITVQRFGWSDESQDDAQLLAGQRATEAMQAILAGQKVPRRERRSNYGHPGVPIREQIVARHGDVVITRNSYGALCLNTPNVLFTDVDLEQRPDGYMLSRLATVALVMVGMVVGIALRHWILGLVLAAAAVAVGNAVTVYWNRYQFNRDGGALPRALHRIHAFASRHPEWHLRVYRTPAGLRVLAMHSVFSPCDKAVQGFFKALGSDHLYSVMCCVQHCFRARLTGKPWRMGIASRISPPSAAWSSAQATLPERLRWIEEYEAVAKEHAACRYMHSLGDTSRVHPDAEHVRCLHDEMTRAGEGLPLA